MTRGVFELVEGILIGAGGILPGISGAALAVVFGFYEEFTALLAHPKRNWRAFAFRRWKLCIGIAAGFAGFTLLLRFFFSAWTVPLTYLFTGFIAGTLPGILKATWRKRAETGPGISRKPTNAEALAFFAALAAVLAFAAARHSGLGPLVSGGNPGESARAFAAFGTVSPVWLFAGALIGTGSLLPGFSASFVLIWSNLYEPLLDAAGTLNLPVLAQVGAGALVSLALFSRLANWLYRKAHGVMSFAVLGLTIGSLVLAFPGITGPRDIPLLVSLTGAGLAASLWLESRLN